MLYAKVKKCTVLFFCIFEGPQCTMEQSIFRRICYLILKTNVKLNLFLVVKITFKRAFEAILKEKKSLKKQYDTILIKE